MSVIPTELIDYFVCGISSRIGYVYVVPSDWYVSEGPLGHLDLPDQPLIMVPALIDRKWNLFEVDTIDKAIIHHFWGRESDNNHLECRCSDCDRISQIVRLSLATLLNQVPRKWSILSNRCDDLQPSRHPVFLLYLITRRTNNCGPEVMFDAAQYSRVLTSEFIDGLQKAIAKARGPELLEKVGNDKMSAHQHVRVDQKARRGVARKLMSVMTPQTNVKRF